MQSLDPLSKYIIPTSSSDTFIYNSEIFISIPSAFLSQITPYFIPIQTSTRLYHINLRYLYDAKNDHSPTIIFLHGHGSCCTWATWLKLAFLLFEVGYNGILMDLPGYGKSTIENETRVNPKLYLNDSGHLFSGIFEKIFEGKGKEINRKIIGVGFCGGAANIIRTINEFPGYFAKRHVLHNSVIGQIPENFEKNLEKFHIKVWVSWCEDDDHTHGCVGYKYFSKKRKEGSKNIYLQDIRYEELESGGMWSKNMGRKTSSVMIFSPSEGYFQFVREFLGAKNDKIPIFQSMVKKEEDVLEKVMQLSKKDAEVIDEDLEKALILSLNDK